MSDGFVITRDAPDGPVHGWFGLSYANYLVVPRSLMQSMQLDWQERMCVCLHEMEGLFGDSFSPPGRYRVNVIGEGGRFVPDRAPHYDRGRTMVRRA